MQVIAWRPSLSTECGTTKMVVYASAAQPRSYIAHLNSWHWLGVERGTGAANKRTFASSQMKSGTSNYTRSQMQRSLKTRSGRQPARGGTS
ncbi:hypothetical protein WJ63_06380 [Burkholderia pyrrocinia]|nr:hypothetical protein WJ63_06380 [Burkholderia pyrrocinia]